MQHVGRCEKKTVAFIDGRGSYHKLTYYSSVFNKLYGRQYDTLISSCE